MAKTGPKPTVAIGEQINSWTIVGYDRANAATGRVWVCQCDCGSVPRLKTPSDMRKYRSCVECRRWAQADLVGQNFGSVTVVEKAEMTRSGAVWRCRCDCGGEVLRTTSNLRRKGNTGCKNCEPLRRAEIHLVHGGAFMGKTRLYNLWRGMTKRCRNLNDPHYGGRGITVCEAWLEFPAFRYWAHRNGYANGLSIDRMNPNKGYSPANCEWVTRSENSRRVHDPKIKEAA